MKYTITKETLEITYRSEDAARADIMTRGLDEIVRTTLEHALVREPKTLVSCEDLRAALKTLNNLKLDARIAGTTTGAALEIEYAEVLEDICGPLTADVYESRHGDLDELLLNREELEDKLTEMLLDFDASINDYQTDVYLYYDPDKHTAELDTFTNVGGNSWLDDDHWCIYSDNHPGEALSDHYDSLDEIADAIGMPVDEMVAKTREAGELDPDDDVALLDVWYYLINRDSDLSDKAHASWRAELSEYYELDAREKASDILDRWESDYRDEGRRF